MEIETETDKLLANSDDNETDETAGVLVYDEFSKLKHKQQHQTDDSSDSEDTEEGADKPVISSNDSDDEDSPNLSNSNKNEVYRTSNRHEYEKVKQETETVEIIQEIDNANCSSIKEMIEKAECQLNDTVHEPSTTTTITANIKVIESQVDEDETFTDEALKLKTISKSTDSPNQSLDFFYSANDLFEYEHVLRRHESRTPDVESGYFEKSDSLYSKEEFEARSSSRQPSQYDQTISESLHNQLNRFDLLIDTIDQRNAMNIASNAEERGYWSTIFGQASEIETYDEMSQEKKAHRALELLEDYHSRLSEPQDRALRIAIERVIRIFKSRLFQALLGKFLFVYNC